MKLIYFVSPYDLLDKSTKTAHPMTVEGKHKELLHVAFLICLLVESCKCASSVKYLFEDY